QSSIEPHITITWLDEADRLVVRTSTQVPFHVRRIVAPLLGIPVGRIRVIKPRVGGGFGGKQEILIEDLCGMLTLRTGRPVRLEYTREEELTAARTRHPQIVTVKSGVREGDDQPIAEVLGEGKEGFKQLIRSCGLPQAIALGAKAIGWTEKRKAFGGEATVALAVRAVPAGSAALARRRGVGMAIVMQA